MSKLKVIYNLSLIICIFFIASFINTIYPIIPEFINEKISELKNFSKGDPLEEPSTTNEKTMNDLGVFPYRFKRTPDIASNLEFKQALVPEDFQSFFKNIELEYFSSPESKTILDNENINGFLIETQLFNGVIFAPHILLINKNGKIEKILETSTDSCDCSDKDSIGYINTTPYSEQEWNKSGNTIHDLDHCGAERWSKVSKYQYHHYWNNDLDQYVDNFWILDSTDLVEISRKTGEEKSRISLSNIINANNEIHIFEPRLKRTRWDRWVYGEAEFVPERRKHSNITNADIDPFHTNDIDQYHGEKEGIFIEGDLLLSFRSLNLLLVVRPTTKEIVWYSSGLTSRQHDPDFIDENTIMVFDNNFHNKNSKIVEIEATSSFQTDGGVGAKISNIIDNIGGNLFQQLTGGTQFLSRSGKYIFFDANYYIIGVNRFDQSPIIGFRVKHDESTYLMAKWINALNLDEYNKILIAKCI